MSTRICLTAVAALLLAGLSAAPAHAEYYAIDDPADASASLTDIYGFTAMHGGSNLLVKVRFNELMRSSAAGVSVFIDTDRDVRGPEFVLSSGLGDGTDYVLTEAVAWRGSDERVDCDYEARPKWGKDVFRALISRDCLDEPGLGPGLGEDGRPGRRLAPGRRLGAQAPPVEPAHRLGPGRHGGLTRPQPAATRATATAHRVSPTPWARWMCSRSSAAASTIVTAG